MVRGIYVSPRSVADAPHYARRLRDEAGVSVFQLRAGFDPKTPADGLAEAVETVRALDCHVQLLVGTWWGHGIEPGADRMRPVVSTRPDFPAHEAQWTMRTPGGPADAEIEEALRGLCRTYQPDGVCLTHARFRHPADIRGLFETGSGPFSAAAADRGLAPAAVAAAWGRALEELTREAPTALASQGATLPAFLDRLARTDLFTRWFTFRCEWVQRSVVRFAQAARGGRDVAFGVNAFGPYGATLVGQDYRSLARTCTFIQPLLGYVRWHVLQPIGAWARLLCDRVPTLGESEAIRLSGELLGAPTEALPDSLEALAQTGEGDPRTIAAVVGAELAAVATIAGISPVLRGQDWPATVFSALVSHAEESGIAAVFFQGTEHLAAGAPDEGWG